MFERFNQDARTLVIHAAEHARRLGHRYVGAEHILALALTTIASGLVPPILSAAGATAPALRAAILDRYRQAS